MPAADALSGVASDPGASKPDPILVVDGVERRYGGLLAVDVDHLEVPRGVITALIGPNGAGKTTFFNLLTGFDRPDGGRWGFDGNDVTGARPARLARAGMVRTFQLTKTLGRMSVRDNMLLAGQEQAGESFGRALLGGWRRQEQRLTDRADELLERFNLAHQADEFAAGLSGGQRKLLEMARSLMADPQLVMLDEPMAGVNPALVQRLLGHVTALRDEGMSVLFVEHDMDVIMSISDWIVCMAEGRIIAEGRPADIAGNEAVIEAYLGLDEAAEEAPEVDEP